MMERTKKDTKTYIHLVKVEQPEDGIDLYELFERLVQNRRSLFAGMLLGVLLAVGYMFWFVAPQYEACVSAYVLRLEENEINAADLQLANFLAADYCEAFASAEVLETAAQKLGMLCSRQQLQEMVQVSNPLATRMLYIRATATNPDEASALANAVFEAGCLYIRDRMHLPLPELIYEAVPPQEPLASGWIKRVIAGAAVGFAAPCVWVFAQYALEERKRTANTISKISA